MAQEGFVGESIFGAPVTLTDWRGVETEGSEGVAVLDIRPTAGTNVILSRATLAGLRDAISELIGPAENEKMPGVFNRGDRVRVKMGCGVGSRLAAGTVGVVDWMEVKGAELYMQVLVDGAERSTGGWLPSRFEHLPADAIRIRADLAEARVRVLEAELEDALLAAEAAEGLLGASAPPVIAKGDRVRILRDHPPTAMGLVAGDVVTVTNRNTAGSLLEVAAVQGRHGDRPVPYRYVMLSEVELVDPSTPLTDERPLEAGERVVVTEECNSWWQGEGVVLEVRPGWRVCVRMATGKAAGMVGGFPESDLVRA